MFQVFSLAVVFIGMMEIEMSHSVNFCYEDCEFYQSRSVREYEACLAVQSQRQIGDCGLSLWLILFLVLVAIALIGFAIWACLRCRRSVGKENGNLVQWLNS